MAKENFSEEQKSKICRWLKLGYTGSQIIEFAKGEGWNVSHAAISNYRKLTDEEFQRHIDANVEQGKTNAWFDREYRAKMAADIAQLLYDDIMSGKQYAVEISEGKFGTIEKPVYYAGMVKNWNDTVKTIGDELGQRKNVQEINYNGKHETSLSVLIQKIYEDDDKVQKQFETAEIVELPPSENDFADDKEFTDMVKKQMEENPLPHVDEVEDEDEY